MAHDPEVHVWSVDLDAQSPGLPVLQPLLSPDEMERATRFHFQRDRNRFRVARAMLRILLGLYTGVSPDRLRFSYGPHGKPRLEGRHVQGLLQFNLSHSQGLALYAFALGREIGIDLEMVRPGFEWEVVAGQVLSAAEVASISILQEEDQLRRFFTLWTRKEALVKALGGGLALPLKQLELLAAGTVSSIPLGIGETAGDSTTWSVLDLDLGRGLVAAVSIAGEMPTIKSWKWDQDSTPLCPQAYVRVPASLPGPTHPRVGAGRATI